MKLPITKEGTIVVKTFLAFAIGCLILGRIFGFFYFFSAFFFVLALFSAYFFRDPERDISRAADAVLSPADGRVFSIAADGGFTVIKIFMSVLNVHVQRSPIDGRVESIIYKPGRFMHAENPRSDSENEQKIITLRGEKVTVKVKQIAGIIARRIVGWVKEGDSVEQGQRLGMIRFGSQVDLFMPGSAEVLVKEGDRVKSGITVMGRLLK
jgi:phosphatidylserine decarboxylase